MPLIFLTHWFFRLSFSLVFLIHKRIIFVLNLTGIALYHFLHLLYKHIINRTSHYRLSSLPNGFSGCRLLTYSFLPQQDGSDAASPPSLSPCLRSVVSTPCLVTASLALFLMRFVSSTHKTRIFPLASASSLKQED